MKGNMGHRKKLWLPNEKRYLEVVDKNAEVKHQTEKDSPTFTIPIFIPTKNGYVQISTMMMLHALTVRNSQLSFPVISVQTSNISKSRNGCMDTIRHNELPYIMCLWIDSDMVIEEKDVVHVEAIIKEGLERNQKGMEAGIVCNYRTSNNGSQIKSARTREASSEVSIDELSNQGIYSMGHDGVSGFGLAFLPMPPQYIFHSDELGEDMYYWIEHPELEMLIYTDFVPRHVKEVAL